MAWSWPGDGPLSEPKMVRLLTHICITQWVNEDFGENWSRYNAPVLYCKVLSEISWKAYSAFFSKLIVGAQSVYQFLYIFYLSFTVWYLNCYFTCAIWHWNQNTTIIMEGNAFENVICKIWAILFRPQCVQDKFKKQDSVGCLNIKMPSCHDRNSHCKGKMVPWPYYI